MTSEAQRLNKPHSRGPAPAPSSPEHSAPGTVSAGPPGPAWAAAPVGAPFGLAGVQRKVAIGESNDVYERQADQVASHVTSGRQVSPGMISPISGAPGAVGQRQAKPEDKKKDEKAMPAPPVQKQSKPEEKKKDEKPATSPVQKQAKPEEKKKDEKPATPPVQKQAKPEEKKKEEKPAAPPVQRETRPEDKTKGPDSGPEPVQRAASDKDAADHKDEAVQTSRGGGGVAAAPSMESAAARAISSKGPGEPLNSSTRGTLESRMGTDLSDVRVHNDSSAHESAGALDARAFTHQNDIWLGRGESQSDTRLMAHEATHVVQQTGSVHRQLVQRADGPPTAPPAGGSTPPVAGGTPPAGAATQPNAPNAVTFSASQITIPTIDLPKAVGKSAIPTPVNVRKDDREETDQRDKWQKEISGPGVTTKVDALLPDTKGIESPLGEKRFYLKLKGEKSFLIGTREKLKERLRLPNWTPVGRHSPLTVDHVHELQLGGPHSLKNVQLLEMKANSSAGGLIKGEIYRKIQDAVKPGPDKVIPPDMPKDPKEIKQKYQVTFTGINPVDTALAGRPD